jgi:hypothetical protein
VHCGLWEILWALQRYKVKKPVKRVIFDFGNADFDLKVLNPHKEGGGDGVGAVGIRVMSCLSSARSVSTLSCSGTAEVRGKTRYVEVEAQALFA